MTANLKAETARQLMVSTDLDGTLLDHHNYSWQPAKKALTALASEGIPVVINTSKTFQEVVNLQNEIGLVAPFVVENGSALFIPLNDFTMVNGAEKFEGYWRVTLGASRDQVLGLTNRMRAEHKWKFEGFADWGVAGIMEKTGLNENDATFASRRAFSEPIVWMDTEENFSLFKSSVADAGLKLLQGGRFIHVLGDTDKGRALSWLSAYYLENCSSQLKWIALGDSQNDVAMLQVADYPVAVKSPCADYPEIKNREDVIYTSGCGPEGWQQAIFELLEKL